jgi:hypothetical protein
MVFPRFVAVSVAGLLSGLASAQIYVSPSGDDHASGGRADPVRTLGNAVVHARSQLGHTVVVAGGTYKLSSLLELTVADSGLILRAATAASVVVSGGERVKGWKQTLTPGLWSASLPVNTPMPRQIYIDGVRAGRTRGRLPVGLTMTPSGYIADADTLARWRNPQALEMIYTGGNGVWGERTEGIGSWTEPRCPVAAIHGMTIVMAEPCWTNSTERVMLPNGARTANLVGPASVGKQPTFIENAFELLGRPGEFYADPETRIIYYTPRRGEDLGRADVETPVLQSLLAIHGSEAAPVHDVTIQGITFSFAGWQDPSTPEGFSEIQANFRVTGKDGATKQALCDLVPGGTCPFAAWTPEPGDVSARYADSIHFDRDNFTHLGAAGLSIAGGAHNDIVEGCRFTDISGNGLELAEVDAPEAPDSQFAVHNKIENNLFRDVGAEFRGGIPIVVGYARYTQISHNRIDTVPYAAMSIGWGGWLDKIGEPGVANRSTGNVIEKNRISHIMLVLSDGGGIYTQGRAGQTIADGERVLANIVTDQVSSGHALYTDNGSAMVTVRGNVVFNANFDDWGSRHKDYYDGGTGKQNDPLAILDNWWEQGDPDTNALQVTEQGNHLISNLAEVPKEVQDQVGLEPKYRSLLQPTGKLHPPEPPSSVTGFITGHTAYVSWRPPVDDGGSPVKRYVVHVDGKNGTAISAEEFARLSYAKLPLSQPDGTHTFSVVAENAAGAGVDSLPSREISAPASPLPLPGLMQRVSAHVSGPRASIHFGMPQKNGEDLIAVVIAVDDASQRHIFTGHRIVSLEGRHTTFVALGGLTPGPHRFGVAAITGAGEGAMQWTKEIDPAPTRP